MAARHRFPAAKHVAINCAPDVKPNLFAMDAPLVDDAVLAPSWLYYIVAHRQVGSMSVRQRRYAFQVMRGDPNVTSDHFMPRIGLTCGEFCIMHVLAAQTGGHQV